MFYKNIKTIEQPKVNPGDNFMYQVIEIYFC